MSGDVRAWLCGYVVVIGLVIIAAVVAVGC